MLKDFSVSSSDWDNRKSEAVGPAGLMGILDTPIRESSIMPSLSVEALQKTINQQHRRNGFRNHQTAMIADKTTITKSNSLVTMLCC